MNATDSKRLMAVIEARVSSRDDFRALAVCGSCVTPSPGVVTVDRILRRWLSIQRSHDSEYGVVWSAHVALEPAAEHELTIAEKTWASVNPIDPGTRHAVQDGFQILIDKDGALQRLREACS
jgi:hypothetical protein